MTRRYGAPAAAPFAGAVGIASPIISASVIRYSMPAGSSFSTSNLPDTTIGSRL